METTSPSDPTPPFTQVSCISLIISLSIVLWTVISSFRAIFCGSSLEFQIQNLRIQVLQPCPVAIGMPREKRWILLCLRGHRSTCRTRVTNTRCLAFRFTTSGTVADRFLQFNIDGWQGHRFLEVKVTGISNRENQICLYCLEKLCLWSFAALWL